MEKQFDRDLAIAVFQRWSVGEPVSEVSLVKAASALGTNPYDALLEARYYTDLTNYLNRGGGEMNDYEKHIFSGATGAHSDDMCKVASAYMLSDEELILAHLSEQNFVPYLPKLAEAMAQAGTDPNAQQGAAVQQDPELEAQMQQLMAEQQMAQQQQVQAGMVKPTPTAPAQIPPSPTGNSEQLLYNEVNKDQLEQQRQQQMQQQMQQQTQQNPQQGSKEQMQQMYSSMTPEQKIQHAAPQVGQEHRQRYADTLAQVEQTAGLKITDPSQVQKVVKGVEKQDKKIIDEAIKQVTDVQAQAMGGGAGGQAFGPMPGEPGDTTGAPGGDMGAGGDPNTAPIGPSAETNPVPPGADMSSGQGKQAQKPKTPPQGAPMDKMAYLNELRARSFLEKLAISRELKNKAYAEHTARDTAAAFKGDLNSSVGFPSRRDNPLNKHIGLGGGYLERREVKDPIYNRIRPEAGDRETVMANSRARAKQLTNNYSRDLTGLEMANNLNQGGLQSHIDQIKASKANQVMAGQLASAPQGPISQYPAALDSQSLVSKNYPARPEVIQNSTLSKLPAGPSVEVPHYNISTEGRFTGPSGYGVAFDNSSTATTGSFSPAQAKINPAATTAVEGVETGRQRRFARQGLEPPVKAAPTAPVTPPATAVIPESVPTSAVPKKSFFKGKGKMLGIGALGAAGLAGAGYLYNRHKEKTAADVLDELRTQTFLGYSSDNIEKVAATSRRKLLRARAIEKGMEPNALLHAPKNPKRHLVEQAQKAEAVKSAPVSTPSAAVSNPVAHSTPSVPTVAKETAKKMPWSRNKKIGLGLAASAGLGGLAYAYKKHKEKTASEILDNLF